LGAPPATAGSAAPDSGIGTDSVGELLTEAAIDDVTDAKAGHPIRIFPAAGTATLRE